MRRNSHQWEIRFVNILFIDNYCTVFYEGKVMREKLKKFLLPLIPALIVGLLTILEPFDSVDYFICDTVYSNLQGTSSKIKIITIDEETLSEYGNFSNWSREKSAELVELLCEDEATAPSLVGFDIMFIGESEVDTLSDKRLVEACEKAGNVVLATNLVYRGETKIDESGELYYDKWNIEMEEMPFDALSEVTKSGFANVQQAKDGYVRYAQLFAETEHGDRTSFAYALYENYMEIIGETPIIPETNGKNQITFFYSGEVGEFSNFSLKDVLNGTVPKSEFTDCIVLVGAYAAGMQDAYKTPVNRGKNMNGVEINANVLQALMDGKTATKFSNELHALVVMVITYVYFYFARKQKLFLAMSEAVVFAGVHLVVGRILALNGQTITQLYVLLVLVLIIVYFLVEKYLLEKIRRRKMLSTFKKYMAPQVVDKLTKGGEFEIKLGGEKREVAVLFVDIRGFTPMSENLLPEQVVDILNEYLSLTTECIFKHNGMLDKFIGDATMAVFNAPFDLEDYLYEAVATAWDIKSGSEKLEKKLMEQFGRTISFGIGVNCGDAVVGNIGCDFRMDYTAIGDTVNTAARLESKAKPGQILISDKLYEQLSNRIEAEAVGEMELKGKSNKIMVYSVTSINKK